MMRRVGMRLCAFCKILATRGRLVRCFGGQPRTAMARRHFRRASFMVSPHCSTRRLVGRKTPPRKSATGYVQRFLSVVADSAITAWRRACSSAVFCIVVIVWEAHRPKEHSALPTVLARIAHVQQPLWDPLPFAVTVTAHDVIVSEDPHLNRSICASGGLPAASYYFVRETLLKI